MMFNVRKQSCLQAHFGQSLVWSLAHHLGWLVKTPQDAQPTDLHRWLEYKHHNAEGNDYQELAEEFTHLPPQYSHLLVHKRLLMDEEYKDYQNVMFIIVTSSSSGQAWTKPGLLRFASFSCSGSNVTRPKHACQASLDSGSGKAADQNAPLMKYWKSISCLISLFKVIFFKKNHTIIIMFSVLKVFCIFSLKWSIQYICNFLYTTSCKLLVTLQLCCVIF